METDTPQDDITTAIVFVTVCMPFLARGLNALMLGEAAELALGSYRIVPRRLTEEFGFSFGYADIEAALESAIALNS